MVKCRLSIEMIQSYLRYSPQVHSILHYGLYGLLFHFPSKIASPFAVLEMVDWIDLISVFPWASLYFFLSWTLFLHRCFCSCSSDNFYSRGRSQNKDTLFYSYLARLCTIQLWNFSVFRVLHIYTAS